MKALGTLDRYILKQWIKTFLMSALGIPAVAILIQLSEKFGNATSRGATPAEILLGGLYGFPYQVALLFPAGILFATVFTLNSMGRRSELTAAKAGGVSFLRLITPILLLSIVAIPINFGLQEVAALSSGRQRELYHEKPKAVTLFRSNATLASRSGWIYNASGAYKEREEGGKRLAGLMHGVLLDGPASEYPRRILSADSALWSPSRQNWTLYGGNMTLIYDSTGTTNSFLFRTMQVRDLNDPPRALVDEQKRIDEMQYREAQEYVAAMRRSASIPGQLEVDMYLKLALPVACLVVALFGAPLAVTNPRAGAALGLAMALGTTLIYLTGTQIMKAVGGKGMIPPPIAAWSMNVFFGLIALYLLSRVRS